jgi:hypothetical protein
MKKLFIAVLSLFVISTVYSQKRGLVVSHYLFPEFKAGKVYMSTGKTEKNLFNYNTVTEEMLFRTQSGNVLAIGKHDIPFVDSVVIDGRKFIHAEDKFMELLIDGETTLVAEYVSSVIPPGSPAPYGGTSHTSATDTYSSLYAGGLIYKMELPDDYKVNTKIYYWLSDGETSEKLTNIRQIKRHYKDKSQEYKSYTKENDVNYDNPDSILGLIRYMEQ